LILPTVDATLFGRNLTTFRPFLLTYLEARKKIGLVSFLFVCGCFFFCADVVVVVVVVAFVVPPPTPARDPPSRITYVPFNTVSVQVSMAAVAPAQRGEFDNGRIPWNVRRGSTMRWHGGDFVAGEFRRGGVRDRGEWWDQERLPT